MRQVCLEEVALVLRDFLKTCKYQLASEERASQLAGSAPRGAREYFRMRVSVRGQGMSVMRVTSVRVIVHEKSRLAQNLAEWDSPH